MSIGFKSGRHVGNGKGGKASRIEIEVQNTTKHDVNLRGPTVLGRLQLAQSVVRVDVRLKTDHRNVQQPPNVNESSNFVASETRDCTSMNLPDHLKNVTLDDLTSE